MYILSGRSCALNAIFVIFTEYVQRPRELMVKQDTWAISYLYAISSERSGQQLDQRTASGQISLGMRTVPVPVLSLVSGDSGNGFPSRSFIISITLASDSHSTMTKQDLSGRV